MRKQNYFCSSFAQKWFKPEARLWDQIIAESANFVVVPSLGSLVPGWLLVVPKEKVLAIGNVPENNFIEFEQLVSEVAARATDEFGPVSIFEHGAARPASSVGCGVDYAHVHIVPTSSSLLPDACQLAPNIRWERVVSIRATQRIASEGMPYLYYQDGMSSEGYLGTADELPSQLFRRVIAAHLGKPELYDWKQEAGLQNIATTLSKLCGKVETFEVALA